MKNILLKSVVVFVVMSILNAELSKLFNLLIEEQYKFVIIAITSTAYFNCMVISIVGLITIMIFKKNYNSILRIALLFQVLYLLLLIISRINPFEYFINKNNINLMSLLFYTNSFVVFGIMCIIHFLYSKIILTKSKN